MNDLSAEMQERLDKWKKNTLPVPSVEIFKRKPGVKFVGKGDKGDVYSEEQWGEEVRKSQRRK